VSGPTRSPSGTQRSGLLARTDCTCVCSTTTCTGSCMCLPCPPGSSRRMCQKPDDVNLFLRGPSDTGRLGLLARTDCTCVCSATAHLDWWCSSTIGRQSTAAAGWTGVPNDSGKTERFASSEPSQGTGGGELGSVKVSAVTCIPSLLTVGSNIELQAGDIILRLV
jgi:hypothetical protein